MDIRDVNGLTRRGFADEPEPSPDISTGSDSAGETDMPSQKSRSSTCKLLAKIVVSVLVGVVFGYVSEKGRVFEPRSIRHQMVFKKMIMLKMFISALATGMFGLSLMAMIPSTHRKFIQTCNKYYNDLCDKGVVSSILGGTLLGIGITLAGSCPTIVFVQVGASVQSVGYTFVGALAGALLYSVLKPITAKISKPVIDESSNPWISSPYFIMALPLAAMFGIVVCSFELLVPWTKDVKIKDNDVALWEMKAWPPYLCGVTVGALQVPLLLVLGETLGGSISFTVMVAQLLIGPLKNLSPFIAKHRWGFQNWWQIFYVCGIMYGAYLSSSASGYIGRVKGVPPTYAFIGGCLMILGTRIAGGCTSGHGLSGMSFLSILSVITTACMFGAAIATGIAMKAMGVLKIS